MTSKTYVRDVIAFVALMATAVALGGALAHALEFPNKIAMSRDHYFIVQRAYDGWNQLAYVLAIELLSMLGVAWVYWDQPRVVFPTLVAIGALLAAQAIFWVWTFPANQLTGNWTVAPENWSALRSRWEYSHLGGAGFQVLAMAALIVAILRRREARDAD